MFSANKPKEEKALSLLEGVPSEIKGEISRHLSLADLGHLSCVSSAWYGSKDAWMFLVARDFDIPIETVRRFAKYANSLRLSFPISFASIYRCRRSLSKAEKKPGGHYSFYLSPEYHLSLLALCVNHPGAGELLLGTIPPDEVVAWLRVAIKSHLNHTAQLLVVLFPRLPLKAAKAAIEAAVKAENTEMAIFLLERDPGAFSRDMRYLGMLSLGVFNYLLAKKLIRLDENTISKLLHGAIVKGNIQLIEEIWSRIKDGRWELKAVDRFRSLIQSLVSRTAGLPNQTVFPYLLGKFPPPELKFGVDAARNILSSNKNNIKLCYQLNPRCFPVGALAQVGQSGDVEAVRFVIETFKVSPREILEALTLNSKNFDSLRYLLDACENFVPDQRLFYSATANERQFRYLMQRFNYVPDNSFYLNVFEGLIRHGQIKLFEELYQAYPAVLDEVMMLYAAITNGDAGSLQRLMRQFNWQLRPSLLHEIANSNIAVVRVFSSSFLETDVIRDFSGGEASCNRPLFNSNCYIFSGLKHCRAGAISEAQEYWELAAKHSIRHFFAFVTRAVQSPSQYQLKESHTSVVCAAAQQSVLLPFALIERDVIYEMLSTAKDERLIRLASAFRPFQSEQKMGAHLRK